MWACMAVLACVVGVDPCVFVCACVCVCVGVGVGVGVWVCACGCVVRWVCVFLLLFASTCVKV